MLVQLADLVENTNMDEKNLSFWREKDAIVDVVLSVLPQMMDKNYPLPQPDGVYVCWILYSIDYSSSR